MDQDLPVDSPVPRRATVRMRRVGAAAAAGLGITLGVAGIAAAADPSPGPSKGETAQFAPQGPPPESRHHRRGPDGDHKRGPGGAIRGEFVVPDGKGGFRAVQTQRGTVTAVSSTSLTVKSEDGVSKTYVLTKDTKVNAGRDGIATVEKGELVAVLATVSGGKATATNVRDLTKIRAQHEKWGPPPPPGLRPGGTPAEPSGYDGPADSLGA